MNEDHDPILDACLDEVLAGRQPPDLTARILQAWAMRGHANGAVIGSLPADPLVSALPGAVVPPPIFSQTAAAKPTSANGQPVVELRTSGSQRAARRPSSAAWQIGIVAASLLGVAAIGIATFRLSESRPEIAKHRPGKSLDNASQQKPTRSVVKNVPAPNDTPAAAPRTGGVNPPQVVHQPSTVREGGSSVVGNDPAPEAPTVAPSPAVNPPTEPRYVAAAPDPEVISFVNAELTRSWTENGVTPSPPATDAEWCRRVFVRILGRIPTVEELQAFQNDKTPKKRAQLVDRLLTNGDYIAEYASHWATIWSNVLIGRTGGQGESLANREGLEQYLRTSLARNKPYNQMVAELLTATGSARPGTPDYNGAVNFLLDGMNEGNVLASARVSRVFLGQQLQCAQCHAHPTQNWSQEDFWAFNSFFRQMHAQREGETVRLTNVDFPGEGRGSQDGEVFFETPQGLLKTAFPKFIDGKSLPPSGDLAQVDRRGELAKLIGASDELPKALVNRMWSHFFGYGFTHAVDDLGPNVTPSHPDLLDRLTQEFVAHQYDLRSVIRWIALSDPFGRSSKLSNLATKDMPEAGEIALFSRYYSRQMQAEEVYNSLVQAAQIRKTAATDADIAKARVDWLAQFSRNMDTDEGMEEQHFSGGMRQSLIMMNGDLMKQAVSSQHEGLLKSVAASNMTFEKKVEHLFLSAVSRKPTGREQQAAATILQSGGNKETAALEDIWWAILNSNEFILDH